jgi:hypothetical protein
MSRRKLLVLCSIFGRGTLASSNEEIKRNMDFVIHTDPIVLHPELYFGERVYYYKLYSI